MFANMRRQRRHKQISGLENSGAAQAAPLIFIMSAIRDGRLPIILDKQRHLLFSLNVLDEMQDKFGGYDKLNEALSGNGAIKNLKWLLCRLINEGAEENEPQLEESTVGKLIHVGNLDEIKNQILSAFMLGSTGSPESAEPDADDDPDDYDIKNVRAGGE